MKTFNRRIWKMFLSFILLFLCINGYVSNEVNALSGNISFVDPFSVKSYGSVSYQIGRLQPTVEVTVGDAFKINYSSNIKVKSIPKDLVTEKNGYYIAAKPGVTTLKFEEWGYAGIVGHHWIANIYVTLRVKEKSLPIQTNIPSSMTIDTVLPVMISGGKAPYTVVSSSPEIIKAGYAQGVYTITAIRSGKTSLTITDASSTRITTEVNVTAPAKALEVTVPSSVRLGNSVALAVSGGTPPYNVTTDNSMIAAIRGNNGSYTIVGYKNGKSIVTVKDAASTTIVKEVIVGELTVSPAPQALQVTAPSSMLMGGSMVLKISGGTPPYAVTTDKPEILTVRTNDGTEYPLLGLSAGKAVITVRDAWTTKRVEIVVTPRITQPVSVTDLRIMPMGDVISMVKGERLPFQVQAIMSDGTQQNVTEKTKTMISNPAIIDIKNTTLAASRAGSSTLTISYGKLTKKMAINVREPAYEKGIQKVFLDDKSPIVTNAYTQFQLALIAVYTDGTSKDVTLEAQWYISHSSTVGVRNFSRMTVDNGMITTAGGPDRGKVTATYKGKSASIDINVRTG
jgi:hypothetical protein